MSDAVRICTQCKERPSSPSHPWCAQCVRAKKLTKADANGTAKPGALKLSRPPHPPYSPFAEGAPPDLPEWAAPYIVALSTYGEHPAASAAVVIAPQTARLLREGHALFAQECQNAIQHYASNLAYGLPDSTRPVGSIVELKKHRPQEYVERNLTTKEDEAPNAHHQEHATAIVARLTGFLSLSDHAAMLGWIVDRDPVTGRTLLREPESDSGSSSAPQKNDGQSHVRA